MHPARYVPFGLFVLAPLVFGLLALAFGMDADWDLRNYHYYNAYSWLTGRHGWDMLAAQGPSFYNPTIDVPFFVLAEALPARLVGFLLGAVHGVNFILLFLIARHVLVFADEWAGVVVPAVLAAIGVTGGCALSEVGTVFYDNVTSLGVYASILIVVARWDELWRGSASQSALLALAAGLPVGLASGLKLPTTIFAIGLCAAFLPAPGPVFRRVWIAFFFGLAVLAGMAIAAGHWMWFLWQTYGNPLFPFFNDLFRSPMALPAPYREAKFLQTGWAAKLSFPWRFTFDSKAASEIVFRDARVLAAYVAIALAAIPAILRALAGRHQSERIGVPGPTGWLLWAAAVSYAAWLQIFAVYRYLLPLEMLSPLLIVLAAGLLPLPLWLRRGLALLVLAAVAALTIPGDWARVPWTERWVTASTPRIERPKDTIVLMAGHEPLSYLIPSFPPSMRFLRIDSTFTHPREDGNGFNPLMKGIVAEHKGPLAVLFITWEERDVHRKLDEYALHMDRPGCQTVTSPIGPAPYLYCPVRRGRVVPVPMN